jgi:hypothetical protein
MRALRIVDGRAGVTAPAPWPSSIHPVVRDNRWNRLLDFATVVYRELADDDALLGMSAKVRDGNGQVTLVIRDGEGVRRLTVAEDVAGEAGAA